MNNVQFRSDLNDWGHVTMWAQVLQSTFSWGCRRKDIGCSFHLSVNLSWDCEKGWRLREKMKVIFDNKYSIDSVP